MNRSRSFGFTLLVAVGLMPVTDLVAQPLTYRTPNLEGTWVTSSWNLHFQFNHRFRVFGEDADVTDIFDDAIIDNSPTFTLSLGLWSPVMAGVQYASAPAIRNPDVSNEWFPYVKVAPWREGRWSVSALAGYNTQAESADGELAAQVGVDRFELIGAVRGFSDALHTDESGVALAGGLGIRLTNYLMLAGDVSGFVAGPDTGVAFSAGLQLAIPFTPHTFSLQVSNAAATTLQESSFDGIGAAGGNLTWGFEFTVPFSGFARWSNIFDRGRDREPAAPGVEPARVVEIDIRQFSFEGDTVRVPAGAAVRWVNRDPVAHNTAAEDLTWSSPLIGPGETYTTRLTEPGVYPYFCPLHPFMRSVIVVEPDGDR